MNTPFENKCGCLEIVSDVLEFVRRETPCAFIMPDKRLEANEKKAKRILQKHTLPKIIKLPNEIFTGTTTSIFVFKSSVPQKDKKIFAYAILEDGLEAIKNQGRQDVKNAWESIEEYWADVIYTQSGDDSIQCLKPSENLSYQIEEMPFHITEHDFKKTILNHLFFKLNINPDEFKKKIIDFILFNDSESIDKGLLDVLTNQFSNKTKSLDVEIENWEEFLICGKGGLFELVQPSSRRLTDYLNEGKVPFCRFRCI